MNAVRMTSCCSTGGRPLAGGDGTYAQRSLPAASFSASVSAASASSRSSPSATEFSISSSETTEASRALIAATILSC